MLAAAVLGALCWTSPSARLRPSPSAFLRPTSSHPTRASAPLADESVSPLDKLLADMAFLGPMRFIVQGPGAILESVAEVEGVSRKTLADGSVMATLKTDDATFEAHLRVNEIGSVKMDTRDRPDGTPMYFVRFFREDGDPALTCLLHAEGGKYEADAVEFWQGLRDHFGETITLAR